MEKFLFNSRRSPVVSLHGVAASSNALVSEIGARILHLGGNAADASVAMAAALNVTEPSSTGIGGDCFCLFYEAQSKKVKGLNARLVLLYCQCCNFSIIYFNRRVLLPMNRCTL